MTTYNILSLDGGGIRGVLTATLLERLEEDSPGFMASFDLIAGTSTGGILALALASGLTPTQVRKIYESLGKIIFVHANLIQRIPEIGQLVESDYSNRPLKNELIQIFGEKTLNDLPKKVIISSFDLDNESQDIKVPRAWKPKFFHNFPGADSDGAELVVDVALRTSAAPTFFPMYQGYVDGGLIANNPSLCALAQALHPTTGQQDLANIRLISVSTGQNPKYIPEKDKNWGLVQWAPHLISLMMEGSVGLANFQCKQILGDNYIRVDPILPVDISLDGVSQISLMETLAEEFDLSKAAAWIQQKLLSQN